MLRRRFTKLVLVLALVIPATSAMAQPVANKPAMKQHIVGDITRQLDRRNISEGRSVLFQNEHVRLVAQVRRGKLISVTPFDVSGKIVSVSRQSGSGGTKGTRPCIWCYNLGAGLDSNCIEVPCWLIPYLKRLTRLSTSAADAVCAQS